VIEADGGTIDNGDACFELYGPAEYWREEAAGAGGTLVWTHATDFPDPSNYAVWRLFFAVGGEYRVEAHVPAPWGESTQTQYVVDHVGGPATIGVDQSMQDGWVDLGTFEFAAATDHSVRLDDNTGEPNEASIQIALDALRIVPVDVGGGESESGEPPLTSGDPDDDGGDGPGSGLDDGMADDSASGGDGDGTGDDGGLLPGAGVDTPPGCGCTSGGPARLAWLLIPIAFGIRRGARAGGRAPGTPRACNRGCARQS
jgi:hypothetical protein